MLKAWSSRSSYRKCMQLKESLRRLQMRRAKKKKTVLHLETKVFVKLHLGEVVLGLWLTGHISEGASVEKTCQGIASE